MPFWITWSSCLKGLIQSRRGDYEAGLARMQKSVIGYRATGARIGLVHFMTELAETLLAARDTRQGMAVIDEAQAIYARTGNSYHAADLHRVRGELLIAVSLPSVIAARAVRNAASHSGERRARLVRARSSRLRAPCSRARPSACTSRASPSGTRWQIDLRHADEVLEKGGTNC